MTNESLAVVREQILALQKQCAEANPCRKSNALNADVSTANESIPHPTAISTNASPASISSGATR